MVKRLVILVALALTPLAWGGDEYHTPAVREGSAYESSEPRYRVVGLTEVGEELVLWVVADPAVVLHQRELNRVIKDIRNRVRTPEGTLGFTHVWFYSAVGNEPKFPAFHISDHLAFYSTKENKTHFGPAAGALYGGWAYGPRP